MTPTPTPVFRITSPTPGQKVVGVTPKIAVEYSSDPVLGIDPTTLSVTVNGANWTSRFQPPGSNSAQYFVTADDGLVAGREALSIDAAIRDGTGKTLSDAKKYDVRPILEAIEPAQGLPADPSRNLPGTSVDVGGTGFDGTEPNNVLRFRSATGLWNPATQGFDAPSVDAKFTSVSDDRRKGKIEVPEGAGSGPVVLLVNNQSAAETLPFVVTPVLHYCGNIKKILPRHDGRFLMWIYAYTTTPRPDCPVIPNMSFSFSPRNVLAEYSPGSDGAASQVTIIADPNPAKTPGQLTITGVALDKQGNHAILLRRYADDAAARWATVSYKGVTTSVHLPGDSAPSETVFSSDRGVSAADFDADGNLWLAYTNYGPDGSGGIPPNNLRLVKVSRAQLAAGGAQLGESIMEHLADKADGSSGTVADLRILCNGKADLAVSNLTPGQPWVNPVHPQLKVLTLSGPGAPALGPSVEAPGNRIEHLSLAPTVDPDQIFGLSLFYDFYDDANTRWILWKHKDGAIQTLSELPYFDSLWDPIRTNDPFPVTITPSGAMLGADPPPEAAGMIRLALRPQDTVSPQDVGTETTALCYPCPRAIKILPSTTRWRPQRDTTKPIKVVFKGPKDLETTTVKLEVTPPTGYSGPEYKPTPGPVAKVSGKEDEYEVEWKGPWTFTVADNKPQPMPRGNYTLKITGERENSDEVLEGEKYDKVSLVEVTELKLYAFGGSQLDANPGVPTINGAEIRGAEGDRIFAESNLYGNATIYDQVQVVAKTEPEITIPDGQEKLKVYFRAIDVDDPSADGGKLDDEGKPDDNRANAEAGLFRQPPALTIGGVARSAPDAAIGAPLEYEISSGNSASPILRVSARQGDNYRVVASTSNEWAMGLRAQNKTPQNDPNTSGAKLPAGWLNDKDGKPIARDRQSKQVTKLLTVWRTLNIEMDRLVAANAATEQARMDTSGTATKISGSKLEDSTKAFKIDDTLPNRQKYNLPQGAFHSKDNDWLGGDVSLGHQSHGQLYDIWANTAGGVSVTVRNQPNMLNGANDDSGLQDKTYRLRDDDLSVLQSPLQSGHLALAKALFRRAYVDVREAPQSAQDQEVPFVLALGMTMDRRNLLAPALTRLPSQYRSSPWYWSVQLVSAFEGMTDGDFDPTDELDILTRKRKVEDGNLGLTDSDCTDFNGKPIVKDDCGMHAAVYMESIRDLFAKPPNGYPTLAPRATVTGRAAAHELLHALGVPHPERVNDTVMCANRILETGSSGDEVNEEQVDILRRADRPKKSASAQKTCE